jgi:hypothetical protein
MNAVNNERYVVTIRRENDTLGTLRTYAFITPEEACKFAENKRAEVSYDMEPTYSLVKVLDADAGVVLTESPAITSWVDID